jgi:hypothetical protein
MGGGDWYRYPICPLGEIDRPEVTIGRRVGGNFGRERWYGVKREWKERL